MNKEKKYNLIYKTTNLINNKIYIGVHCTDDLNDGYIGCGIRSPKNTLGECPFHKAVRKYGYENFNREVLYNFDTRELAFWYEKYIVDKEFINRQDTYNASPGGRGGSKKGRILGTSIFKGQKRPNISKARMGQPANNKRKVRCITTNKVYNSIKEAHDITGANLSKICDCCRGRSQFSGKLPDGTKLIWEYYHE